jgi:hypothetical protein
MKLVSLKNVGDSGVCSAMGIENYGYGLRLYLAEDQCEALGITKALRAGTQVTLKASAIVVSSTESLSGEQEAQGDVSLSLQITDMGVEVGSVLRTAAQLLYGDAEG